MDEFVWKESFSIGIEEIDLQHQTLLKCLNECINKAPATLEDGVVLALLDEIRMYADTHFKAEENLMRSVSYPELEEQQQQHNFFVEQLAQMERAVNSGDKHVISSLAAFLRDWFVQHILEQDKRIGVYMLSLSEQEKGQMEKP